MEAASLTVHADHRLLDQALVAIDESVDVDDALAHLAGVLAPRWAPTRLSLRIYDPRSELLEMRGLWSVFPSQVGPGVRIPARSTSFFKLEAAGEPILERWDDPPTPMTLMDQLIVSEGHRAWTLLPLVRDRVTAGVLAVCVADPERLRPDDLEVFGHLAETVQDRLIDLAGA